MPDPEQYHDPKYSSKLQRNPSAVSQHTAASAIADSTISYGESLRLSQFPPPPSSIPATPISQASFPIGANSFTTATTIPLVPLRRVPPASTATSASRTLSPYDWHEGASSIDVDAAEDRLLPTSFITSLLQENTNHRNERRVSIGSDAISGISEMTYPPLLSYAEATRNDGTLSQHLSHRHGRSVGVRLPPSSFAPIPEHERRLSGDSETIYDQGSSIIRSTSTKDPQVAGSSVIGISPAKLHDVSPRSRYISRQDNTYDKEDSFSKLTENDSISHYKELHKATSYAMPIEHETPIWLANSQGPRILQPVRSSVYSAKSTAPSMFSRISSNKSIRRAFAWRRKPLPPVPIIPHISIATEMEHRREDEVTPLPDLVNRAGALRGLLEKGHHPHHSIESRYPSHAPQLSSGFDDADTMAAGQSIRTDVSPKYTAEKKERRRSTCSNWIVSSWQQNRRWFVLMILLVLIILGGVIAVAIVFAGRNRHGQAVCSNGFVGANCNLNATCVCTVSSSTCNPLAQNIVDLVPSLNTIFEGNETAATVYNAVWATLGTQTGNNCASQSLMVDIGGALNPAMFPNRTTWVQAALLWNLFKSQDESTAAQLQVFVAHLPWHELDGSDGPVSTTQSSFTTTVKGYVFNFAGQTVLPSPASFIHDGQPLSAQISRVSVNAQSTLDHMYSYAVASSQQADLALTKYWTGVLKQDSKDLSTFKSALSVSPVLLPFDGSSSLIRGLYSNSMPNSFPPPLACYPNLSTEQMRQIDAVETALFGLDPISNSTQIDTGCYPARPVYGVIDILRLRLPFSSSRQGVPKQAVVLAEDALPRVIVSVGEALSALPESDAEVALTSIRLDPRNSGTFGDANHVLLKYLSSIPRTDVATALVEFVLNTVTLATPVPPASSSLLFESIDLLPALEVAVFGTISPSDIKGVYSSFTTPSGALFFGSGGGAAMRNWTISGVQSTIVWAENTTSPIVLRDSSFSDSTVEAAWNASATAIVNNLTNVGVWNITTSLSSTGKLTP